MDIQQIYRYTTNNHNVHTLGTLKVYPLLTKQNKLYKWTFTCNLPFLMMLRSVWWKINRDPSAAENGETLRLEQQTDL